MKDFVSNKTTETVKKIVDYYYSKIVGDYIPGIVNEGNLFENGSDLYIKIIAVKEGKVINDTWVKENLSRDDSDGVFNIITSYKYKYNSIYGINPHLLSDEITFVEQRDKNVFSMEFIDSEQKIKKSKILEEKDNDIMIYYPSIEELFDEKWDDLYSLYAEIEYRIFKNDIYPDIVGAFTINNNAYNLIYQLNDLIGVPFAKKNKLYWLRATIKLDLNHIKNESSKLDDDICVVDLGSGAIRKININNYNDDVGAGFVAFSKEAAKVIKKYYYFYDLKLVPKNNYVEMSLVDYFDDVIVFWEGEYNSKLPFELKEEIKKYNICKIEKIISPAMYSWQLQSRWDIFDELLPNQKLAYIAFKQKKQIALEYGVDFYPPFNMNDYSDFVLKIMKIFGLSFNNLRLSSDKVAFLKRIIDCEDVFMSREEMINSYYGFCYLVVGILTNEKTRINR